MKKNQMYLEISKLTQKKKEFQKIRRIDTFFLSFMFCGIIVVLTIIVLIIHSLFNFVDSSPHFEGIMYYVVVFVTCLLVILGFGIYAFVPSIVVTEVEIQKKAEELLKEFESFATSGHGDYQLFCEIIIRSKEQLEETMSGLQEMLEIKPMVGITIIA